MMRAKLSRLILVLGAICVVAVVSQNVDGACADLAFDAPANYPGGLQTHGLAVGDLNGDGHVDLAAANESSGTLIVRFGNGAGAFPTSIQFFTSTPSSVAIADLNNDGVLDLVTSNRGPNAIVVRLGLGGGAFAPPAQTSVGSGPSGIATSDFNGDGNVDIVTSNSGNAISLLLGNGSGLYPSVTPVSIPGASGAWAIVAADFNGDGNRDVATANRTTLNVAVLFGNGSGGFNPGGLYAAGGTEPTSIAAGDLNGDGRPDLVTTNSGSNNAVVRMNDGNGIFASNTILTTAVEPFGAATGDLDNDGDGDVIVTNRRSRTVSVFRSNGSGSFAPRIDLTLTAGPRAIVAADLNGNGTIDLATGIDTSNITVIMNACSPNSAPTISAASVIRQQDTSDDSTIATVGDDNDAPGDLEVTINGAGSASVNGVTVSNLSVDASGNVNADVSASCGASDAEFTVTVTDSGGLSASGTLTVDVTNETTPPLINKGNPVPDVTVYLPLNSPDVSMAVNFTLPSATDNCTGSPVVTSSPESGSVFGLGSTTVTVTATDDLENTSTATFTVKVLLNFGGMLPPIDPLPGVNSAAAGSSVPVKFSLSGFKGMNVIAEGYPASSPITCGDTEPTSTIEETQSTGDIILTYDAVSDQYTYIWKTDRAWRRTCRILILRLADGTEHYASFSFR